jgi:molybdopterin synthase catalytic subunit
MIDISLQQQAFDVAAVTSKLRQQRLDIGALVTFTGIVRDVGMTLEHYPALASRELRAIADEAEVRFEILAGHIIHRYGPLAPGDDIVLVAIASRHRAAAFDAANFLMDWLKTRAPFWKAEARAGGTQWVEARAEDDAAAARWDSQIKPVPSL